MDKTMTYQEQLKRNFTLKLRKQLEKFPPYVKQFFRGKELSTSERTLIGYAYDLNIFFQYLKENKTELQDIGIEKIPISVLEELTIFDMEDYQNYLKLYHSPTTGILQTNSARGIARKLSALRSFFLISIKEDCYIMILLLY